MAAIDTTFSVYRTSVGMWSQDFFSKLTFTQVLDLDYPCIQAKGHLDDWEFSDEIPSTSAASQILPMDSIPHLDDIMPISREWEDAFANGARSVWLKFSDGKEELFHFQKVRRCHFWLNSMGS
jgi:hypothetical protein